MVFRGDDAQNIAAAHGIAVGIALYERPGRCARQSFLEGVRLTGRDQQARAFTRRARPALECWIEATQILFEGNRAVGVEYRRGKKKLTTMGGEILCCGGAINSPTLLQHSGVGPGERLTDLGIDMVQDLPGVGGHLQDHLEVYVQHACTEPVSLYPALAWWRQPWIGAQWLFGRTGIGASNHFEAGGFVRSAAGVEWPDVQLHFLPVALSLVRRY